MRRIVLAVVVGCLFIGPASIVGADEDACVESAVASAAFCEKSMTTSVISVVRPTGSSGNRTPSSANGKKYVPYDRLTTGPDGQACVTTGYAEEGVKPTDVAGDPEPWFHVRGSGDYSNFFTTYPPCPAQPRAPGQPAPVETPAMVSARYWELIPLPKPQPKIAPGRAITGKLAYLETNGELTHTYTNSTAFGPLEIVAKGSYTVDWGDGTTTGPHSFEGKPWPDGEITHGYRDIGSYNVVVTENWTASWRLGGESGVLRTLRTTGRIDDFPVQQIQAVILR